MTNYKPKEAARMLGISVRTLQRWDNAGYLSANRTPTGRRFYTQEQISNYFESTKGKKGERGIMFEDIVNQLRDAYSPKKIILFGSQSKGTATDKSDIDLCIIMDSTDKRRALADMYYRIDTERPIDFLLYTPTEWETCVRDSGSFAYKINREGVVLHG